MRSAINLNMLIWSEMNYDIISVIQQDTQYLMIDFIHDIQ